MIPSFSTTFCLSPRTYFRYLSSGIFSPQVEQRSFFETDLDSKKDRCSTCGEKIPEDKYRKYVLGLKQKVVENEGIIEDESLATPAIRLSLDTANQTIDNLSQAITLATQKAQDTATKLVEFRREITHLSKIAKPEVGTDE